MSTTPPASTYHVCFEAGSGWTVVDVWEWEESFAQFGELLGPVPRKTGLSTEPKVHPVHNAI